MSFYCYGLGERVALSEQVTGGDGGPLSRFVLLGVLFGICIPGFH